MDRVQTVEASVPTSTTSLLLSHCSSLYSLCSLAFLLVPGCLCFLRCIFFPPPAAAPPILFFHLLLILILLPLLIFHVLPFSSSSPPPSLLSSRLLSSPRSLLFLFCLFFSSLFSFPLPSSLTMEAQAQVHSALRLRLAYRIIGRFLTLSRATWSSPSLVGRPLEHVEPHTCPFALCFYMGGSEKLGCNATASDGCLGSR